MADGEAFVVDAEQVQDGGVDVVDERRLGAILWLVAPLVAGAVRDSPLDAAAAEPVGEAIGVVVASLASL